MRLRSVVALVAALGMGACASARETAAPAAPSGPGFTWVFQLSDDTGQVVTTPRITAYAEKRFNMTTVNETSFLSDFEVEEVDGADIANPVVGVVRGAFLFDGRSSLRPDGTVGLEFTVQVDSPVTPFPEETRRVAGRELRVQRPEVMRSLTQTTTRVQPGRRTALAAIPRPNGDGLMTLWGEVAVVSAEAMAIRQRLAAIDLAQLECR